MDVQRLQGIVDIQGVDKGVADLLKVANAYDTAAAASAAALKQINNVGTAAQGPQSAAAGVNSLTSATQQYTQATRARASVDDQLEKAQLRLRLAQTDNAGRVSILRQQYEQLAAAARPLVLSQDELTKRTLAATQAAVQLANAERAVAREQQSQLQAAASGVGRGVLQGVGAGGILGGLGIAGGVAIATRSIIDLGKASTDLAIRAETIGTAYEAATKRAGFASDDLLKKLSAAARGTVADAELQASANKALALGVGQNAQQIADLLAIARQKGKDFGEGTAQAFEDITVGLGRLSPRILDNLGIILDENKIYKEYADAIGVAEGKLSDQEKRQALVNELLRTNTDLISKNATANLDAADKIARSQATIDQAKTRIGAALLPGVAGAADTGASFIESLTGGISARADALNRQLAAQATSAEDYVRRFNAAVRQLNPSGQTRAGTTDELTGQYLALQQLSAAEADQIRLHALDDAGRRESIQGYRESTAAIQDNTQATALNADEIDRLGKSLAIVTDRSLRPYKAAVDDAKASLDAHKTSTAAAKDSVDSISSALSAAKTRFQDFAQAQLQGTKAYADQQFALDQQQAKVQRDLIEFKAPGAGLDRLLAPIQQQIDATDASLKGYASDLDEINSFVEDQTRVVQEATDAQKAYDDAVGSAKDNLSAQQDRLSALQDVYDRLGESIQSAKRDMDDLRHTALVGEGALDDKLFAMEQNIKRQQLVIDQARLRGAGKDEIKKLTDQLDKLRTAEDAARLAGELRYDRQHREIDKAGVPVNEKSEADILAGIQQQQGAIDNLTDAQKQAKTAVEQQKTVVRDAMFDVMDASAAQRDHTAAVEAEKATLERLKVTQTAISKQYDEQKTKLADLKTQLDTTRTDALKPFEDQIDDITRKAELSKLSEKLELDPLKKKIHDLQEPAEKSYGAIVAGMQGALDQIKLLNPQLDHAQAIYDKERDATKAAQTTYDQVTAALTAEQKYFDGLKTSLDDTNPKLATTVQLWKDLATIQGIVNDQNTATPTIPGMRAPYTPGASGAGPGYNANAIDSVLSKAGSPLTGQGQFIIEMSQKYGIPVEIALAMWKVEGNYGTLGASVGNKNPGNLRASNFAAGTNGGFAMFDSWKAGIEGFFDLLSKNTFGYKDEVNQYKQGDISALLKLISTYAPVGDNNNPQAYYQGVVKMIQQLLAIITNGGGATAAGGRAGVINNGNMADDPQPSQYGIDSVVAGAQLGDTFDADRGALGVHAGLDLRVQNGTPVHAPLDLTDLRIGYYADEQRKGYYVTGIDQYGREWYFGHMTAVFVKAGGSIAKGGSIGTVGMGHVHVQLKQVPGGPPIDPSAALDSAAASGAGPGVGAPDPYTAQSAAYQPSRYSIGGPRFGIPIATGVNGVSAAIAGLLPNLDNLTKAVAGVDDAAAAAADGMVNATDEILNHIGYKNKDGAAQLGYINQNGGLSGDGNWSKQGGGGMSIGGPHFGDPIATGANAGMGFGDGWSKGIEDITPKIEDTTTMTLQQLQDDVLTPWQDATRDFFSGAGFGFIGAASEGINSAGNGLAESAGRVGGAAGSALAGGLQGSVPAAVAAIDAIKAALAGVVDKTVTVTINTVHTDDTAHTGSLNQWLRARGDR